ncbi:MAG: extracellular solute-binding protein [Lachnospiraceae bacterium]|nr:extracellular solute-binding protein [Lachnospiraceae bacterium]
MRRPMAKKVLAASMAAAMTFALTACGETATPVASTDVAPEASVEASTDDAAPEASVEEEVSKYTVITDPATGEAYDLGGITVTIRDWFTADNFENPAEPKTDYEEAVNDYREWVQETYNFKIHTVTMGDWGTVNQDFVDYVSAGGDDETYVFTTHSGGGTILSAMKSGLAYDLATIDCLDFSDKMFTDNNCHALYTFGSSIYAMHTGPAEPRTGVYFNKKLLSEAGIDPESIYDMQANDTWTWEEFEKMLAQTTRDLDNDGTIDIWGLAVNEGVATSAAVFSNGGSYVTRDAEGKFVYNFESAETLEALEWILGVFQKYDWNGPADEEGNAASWDYYQGQFKSGGAAFLVDQQYCAAPGNLFADMETEDGLGFVMFPKGPKGSLIQTAQDNMYLIPACYDADKAWKAAFAYSMWNAYVPGYEDYNPFINTTRTGNFDTRACEETVPLMGANSTVELQAIIPNSGEFMDAPFLWAIGPDTTSTISEIIDGMRDIAKQYIDEANQ